MAMKENSKKVLNYLKEINGQNVTAADVADALGFEKRSVDGIFTSAIQRKGLGIRTPAEIELEDGTQVGVVTTGYHSISLDKSLCFALVDTGYSALGTPLYVRIRKRVFPGITVKKRFYQTNYKK